MIRKLAAWVVSKLAVLAWALGVFPLSPLRVEEIPAPRPSAKAPLVVVLPGRGDTLGVMRRFGIAEAIQKAWPEADVLLTGLTMDYYFEGKVAQRLRQEVIEPARRRGRREIWLAGFSLGGTAALLYERDYPGDAAGLALFAPFLGGPKWIKAMSAAGGPRNWRSPAAVPAELDLDNAEVELWRVVKTWQEPAAARRVWLGCGLEDRFYPGARLVAPLLPAEHVVTPAGGHGWSTWDEAAEDIFSRVRSR